MAHVEDSRNFPGGKNYQTTINNEMKQIFSYIPRDVSKHQDMVRRGLVLRAPPPNQQQRPVQQQQQPQQNQQQPRQINPLPNQDQRSVLNIKAFTAEPINHEQNENSSLRHSLCHIDVWFIT